MEVKVACVCCGCLTIEDPGGYEICPVCFWEDGGDDPNHMTLADAKANYARIGAIDESYLSDVRKPLPDEVALGKEAS